ncbi:hypothetical protein EJP67_09775 [Variovorax guangxiensis]|uniref:Uncharacterized protein n=1 Tax=Variovorax guangxiensis TaxID=1775474 RepID=A0A433MHE5_9BURK|nr:hypothetical protein [Variovorax guangxiensis]RUR67348.1 hypothetical protein EJP67_09775 [Variovorax guangxiensis]
MVTTTVGSVNALSRYEDRRAVPERWRRDALTDFLALTEEQLLASFAAIPEWVEVLIRIDHALVMRSTDLFHEVDATRRPSAQLFMRAFGTFRGACRLAMSGQLFESTVLLRSIIESSVYAWKCATSDEHRVAWLGRADDEAGRKASRKLFAWGPLIQEVVAEHPSVGPALSEAYEKSIDLGAHPNVEGIQLSSEVIPKGDDKFEVSAIFMHGPEAVILAIMELAKVMNLVSGLMFSVVGERMRILGIDKQIEEETAAFMDLLSRLEKGLAKAREKT